jgi:RNA polymerase sigma-70 factor, ECF subfamily
MTSPISRMGVHRSATSLADETIIAGIRAGDESAFDALVAKYYAGLYRFAVRYVRQHEAAEDLVHDVLFRIWEQRDRWEIRGTLAGYLYGSVRNRGINYVEHDLVEQRWRHRETARYARLPDRSASVPADVAVELSDLDRAISAAVDRLPTRCRQVFVLSREHGLSYAEIATVMDISPKTVQIQMGRALKALRAAVGPFLAVLLPLV